MTKGNPGITKPCTPRSLEKMSGVHAVICANPGLTLIEIARKMGKTRTYVLNHTTSMDKGGMLLSEDEDERLYPFKVLEPREAMEWQQQIWSWGWNTETYGDRNTSCDAFDS